MFVDTRNYTSGENQPAANFADELLTTKEAATYIGFEPNTLAVWRCNGRHNLRPLKIGRSIRYKKSVLDKFLDEQMKPE